jgi:UDPglucose 6-dehydrogenase
MDACYGLHPDLDLVYAHSAEDLATGCDAIVLVTEWEEFRRLDLGHVATLMSGNVFVDGRNVYDPEALNRAGLRWAGVGR